MTNEEEIKTFPLINEGSWNVWGSNHLGIKYIVFNVMSTICSLDF